MANFHPGSSYNADRASSSVRPWSTQFRSMLFKSIFVAVFMTIWVLLSGTGQMTTNQINKIDPDGSFAGTVAAACAMVFIVLVVDFRRSGSGLPAVGLTRLLMSSTLCAVAVLLLFMASWPISVKQELFGTPVTAEYLSNPKAFALAAAFVCASYFWSNLSLIGFTMGRPSGHIVGFAILFLIVGLGIWLGSDLFGSPASEGNLSLWLGLAIAGFALQPLASIFIKRNIQKQQES